MTDSEPVWQRISVRVFTKTQEMAVWLQILNVSKHMGPVIYMRQDHEFSEAIFYCFSTSFNL